VFLDLAIEFAARHAFNEVARAALLFATVPVTFGISLWTWSLIEVPCIELSRSSAWRFKVGSLVQTVFAWANPIELDSFRFSPNAVEFFTWQPKGTGNKCVCATSFKTS